MQTFDASSLRITINGEQIAPQTFAPDGLVTVQPFRMVGAPVVTRIEVRTGALDAAAMDRLWGPQARLPIPLVVHSRRRPTPRRNARGGLRRLVKTRRLLTITGVTVSGGVDLPMRVVAECVQRQAP